MRYTLKMTSQRTIILAWFLLLLPTLLLGIGALRLLQGEEARLANSSRDAARDRAIAIAGNIDLAIAEVQDGLLETLSTLPHENLVDHLDAWRRTNPLVRNAFVWQSRRGLTFPNPEQPGNDEEADFIRRFRTLFADQTGWSEAETEQAAEPAPRFSSILAERKELRQLAQQAPLPAAPESDSSSEAATGMATAPERGRMARSPGGKGGWRSWYADDQLHLLGWFAPQGQWLRYGIEIEMMALLSRLVGNLPQEPPAGEGYALLDGNSRLVHQTGSKEVTPGLNPLATVAVNGLPHWQGAAYRVGGTDGGHGILLIGSLLVGTFIIAILLGGSLLLWQAWRNQRDARQKTSFIGNISHELKTPLTTIRMYAEMLAEGTINDPAKQSRYLQTIVRESQRLTRLVGNLLDFSRLEQGRRDYCSESINLTRWLPDLFEDQQVRLNEAGLALQLDLPPSRAVITTDRDALEQIILNLVDNAIKYAPEGKQLRLTLEPVAADWQLQLEDRGPGIPPAHRSRVFDKFHRIDSTLTTRQPGSGLGLCIARQLARDLGGELRYQPLENGAGFVLTIPSRRAP